MKKLISMIVIILSFLAFPATGQDAYRIRLKNGGEFKTLKYWSEGDQVKFYIYGGIAGVQKDSIRKIEKTISENIIYKKSQRHQKAAKISPETNDGKNQKIEEKIDINYYRERKEQLESELDRTLERFREATSRRDLEAKDREKKEMRRLTGEIYALTEEVKQKNEGKIPGGWWKEE